MSVMLASVLEAGLGVSCTMPPPPEAALLAVAYINVDGLDGYDPDADTLIAQFEDVDDSGDPSVGDIIRTNRYPLDPDDTAGGGAFQRTQHTITSLGPPTYTGVQLGVPVVTDTGSDQRFTWSSASTRESYFELDSDTGLSTSFGDGFPIGNDGVAADAGSPSQPNTAVTSTEVPRFADDPFIDVDITPPVP